MQQGSVLVSVHDQRQQLIVPRAKRSPAPVWTLRTLMTPLLCFGLARKEMAKPEEACRLDDFPSKQLGFVVSHVTEMLGATDVYECGGELEAWTQSGFTWGLALLLLLWIKLSLLHYLIRNDDAKVVVCAYLVCVGVCVCALPCLLYPYLANWIYQCVYLGISLLLSLRLVGSCWVSWQLQKLYQTISSCHTIK